jgi:hypothetical protein
MWGSELTMLDTIAGKPQIELHIKRDKSIAGLDRLPNRRPDTVYTWICAKLLLGQVARKMASSQMAIPPCGLWSQLLAHDRERVH